MNTITDLLLNLRYGTCMGIVVYVHIHKMIGEHTMNTITDLLLNLRYGTCMGKTKQTRIFLQESIPSTPPTY